MKNTLFILRKSGASQDASSLCGEGREDEARLHHLLSVLLIFCFLSGGGHRCLELHCAQNQFFCHLPNQVMCSPKWAPPHLLLLKMAASRHLCFLPKLFTTQHENYMQWCNMLNCFFFIWIPSSCYFCTTLSKVHIKIICINPIYNSIYINIYINTISSLIDPCYYMFAEWCMIQKHGI